MLRKINSPVLETRCGDIEDINRCVCIRKRKHSGPYWESEGFTVPFEDKGQHNSV